jgi:hypothetical protein
LHTKGLLHACTWFGEDLDTEHSTELGKQTYGGCRQWLTANHILRSDVLKAHFNGQSEDRGRPCRISVEDQVQFGKEYAAWRAAGNHDGGPGDPSKKHGVKRNSILHRLPYWKVLFFLSSVIVFVGVPISSCSSTIVVIE